jgi:hypothetical protein
MKQTIAEDVGGSSSTAGIDYLQGSIAGAYLAGSQGLGPWADDDSSSSDSGPGGTGSNPECQDTPTSNC